MEQTFFNNIVEFTNALPECKSFYLVLDTFYGVNKYSMKVGVYVPEEACTELAFEYYRELAGRNYNSTFYGKWDDITSKDRLELALDQIRHYASTYGTDFQGEAWKPERTGELPQFPYQQLKVAKVITLGELYQKWLSTFKSPIALSKDQIDFLIKLYESFNWEWPSISMIKNRELKYIVRSKFEIKDYSDAQDCLMQLYYEISNQTMLIKSKSELDRLVISHQNTILKKYLTDPKTSRLLAEGFLRNKDFWMTIKSKSNSEVKHLINRLRKAAIKYHKPMEKPLWLNLGDLTMAQRHGLFENEGIFHLTQVYNAISNRNASTKAYVIRNRKVYVKQYNEDHFSQLNNSKANVIQMQILSEISSRVQSKWKDVTVKLPNDISLAVPTSEKNFIGSIPANSHINLDPNSTRKSYIIGIYWKNEWGAHDLDLHTFDLTGRHIGWNADYVGGVDHDVIFSGDITNADPEATELDLFKSGLKDSIFTVNLYNGKNTAEFDLVTAKGCDAMEFHENYMIDPRKIENRIHLQFDNCRNMTLGFVIGNRFYFQTLNLGGSIVPTGDVQVNLIKAMESQADNGLIVENILNMSHIKFTYEPEDECDFDFSSKADIIKFFSI